MTDKTSEEEIINDKVDEKVDEKTDGDGKVDTPQPKSYSEAEESAMSFGWKPKDKWVEEGGKEEDWVPAKHFLKFGELKQQTIARDKQLQKQDRIIKKMKEHHLSVKEAAYQEALETLRRERKAALAEGDFVKAEEVRDRMEETKEKFARSRVLPREVEQEIQEVEQIDTYVPPPEYDAFLEANPWYISNPDRQDEMSKEADTIGFAIIERARQEGRNLTPAQLYKQVGEKIRKLYPEKFSTPKSPVQDRGEKDSDKGKSSPKLTADELAICKEFNITPEKYLAEIKTYDKRGGR